MSSLHHSQNRHSARMREAEASYMSALRSFGQGSLEAEAAGAYLSALRDQVPAQAY